MEFHCSACALQHSYSHISKLMNMRVASLLGAPSWLSNGSTSAAVVDKLQVTQPERVKYLSSVVEHNTMLFYGMSLSETASEEGLN